VKKLLLALAIILPVTAHAWRTPLEGQSEQCRQLYIEKAEVYMAQIVCEKKGNRFERIAAQIKEAQCPLPTQKDIELLLSVYSSSPRDCDTSWAKRIIGY
jgi:hypothetical protein